MPVIDNIKLYLAGALLLLIALLAYGTYHYHKSYYSEVAENKVLQDQIDSLDAKLKQDAELVKKYKADSDARQAAAAAAIAAAQKAKREYEKRAQEILNAPPTDPDACKAADALFNSYIIGDK
jgi:Tfp pilus assembly protein PilN